MFYSYGNQLIDLICKSIYWSQYDGRFVLNWLIRCRIPEAVVQSCSYEKMCWKYAANLQENTHDEVPFQ